MTTLKRRLNPIDAYITGFPKDIQTILQKMRQTILKAAPNAAESISYGMVGYKLGGKPLVYFGGWKNHVGFYPILSGIRAFAKELSKYKQAKGSVQFPFDKPIPYPLVTKIVRYRVKQNALQANIKKGA